jgi:hypothetical protein
LRVRVVRTGGLAGARVVAELEADALGPRRRRQVEGLIAGARTAAAGAPPRRPGGADRFTYEVTIEGAGGAQSLRGGEGALPEAVVELARFVVRHGRKAPDPPPEGR